MDISRILSAVGIIGGMGFVFGAILAIVSRIFRVEEDPRKAQVREHLPGANCGGCGFAGCDAYAQAIVEGKAELNLCAAAGESAMRAMGRIMGMEVESQDKMVAVVKCQGNLEKCSLRFIYHGPRTCRAANLAAMGDKSCQFSCLGFGDCVSACKFGAMTMKDGRIVEVNPDKCVGCRACIDTCPRSVIQMVPIKHAVQGMCSAMDSGKLVRDNCIAGCIGCGKCARLCKFGAITMKNKLPDIDMTKCVGCMMCADNCPTGALRANEDLRRHAVIHYNDCDGCGKCKEACQFDAIVGAPGEKHAVIEWNCVGCGRCVDACQHGCAEMRPGGIYRTRK